jgi:uncharacterized protein (TIGR02300 family)
LTARTVGDKGTGLFHEEGASRRQSSPRDGEAGRPPNKQTKRQDVAKPDLGAKRICPETGRKFYDLNKDPIVSPYTGQSYPRSYFDSGAPALEVEDDVEDKELDTDEAGAELVSLEEADEEAKGGDDLALDDDDDDDVDLGDDDDTFLADDEEDEDDVSGIINVGDDDEEG